MPKPIQQNINEHRSPCQENPGFGSAETHVPSVQKKGIQKSFE
jgi:hypothetical protein